MAPKETLIPPQVSITERAGAWLLDSGIQEPSGGVARYYCPDVKKNRPVSTEITGYAVSAFVYLHGLTGEPAYLEAGLRAGKFLTRTGWNPGAAAMPFECGEAGLAPTYFFDCGIIVRGLLTLWRRTGEGEFLKTAIDCGRSMRRDFVRDGVIHPILTLPDKQPLPFGAGWSKRPGCYQLKSAMAWHDLWTVTSDSDFREWYEESLREALETEGDFLPGTPEREKVMDRLHAYCYFLEGMLPQAQRPECARVLAAGIERTARLLREIAPVFARSDVYAQLLRVRLYASSVGLLPLDGAAAAEEAAAMAEYQAEDADRRIDGGFYFGKKAAAPLPFVNPVSTVFCLQALRMWDQHRSGQLQLRLESLI
jgi:hypothetical protein